MTEEQEESFRLGLLLSAETSAELECLAVLTKTPPHDLITNLIHETYNVVCFGGSNAGQPT